MEQEIIEPGRNDVERHQPPDIVITPKSGGELLLMLMAFVAMIGALGVFFDLCESIFSWVRNG